MIPYDPAELLDLPSMTNGVRRSITSTEREYILSVAEHHRSGLWILTLLYTGMRPGETAALNWADVDFEHNEIHVHAAKESGSRIIKGPKTKAGVRDIPIHTALLPRLLDAKGARLTRYSRQARGTDTTKTAFGGCGQGLSGTWILQWVQKRNETRLLSL